MHGLSIYQHDFTCWFLISTFLFSLKGAMRMSNIYNMSLVLSLLPDDERDITLFTTRLLLFMCYKTMKALQFYSNSSFVDSV